MHLFPTDLDKIDFLLETEAEMLDWQGRFHTTGETADSTIPHTDGADKQDAQDTTTTDQETGKPVSQDRPKYVTNYIGSKQKLIEWIWENTPKEKKSVFDAFNGSVVVAYMYKSKGLEVSSNDRLHFCYHTARAIVENSSTTITDEEIESLLANNKSADTFVQDNFKGIFYAEGVHAIIDSLRANCDKLDGYKKDIALFALGKTCLSGKGGFGHFTASTDSGKRDTPEEFKARFRSTVAKTNALVFDSGKKCQSYNGDINEVLQQVKADLAYFDPPYATEYSTTNYEKAYHFIEGLMTYWKGLTLKQDSKVKHYETDHITVTKNNVESFFKIFRYYSGTQSAFSAHPEIGRRVRLQ
jgi:adenine-specific DNA-methyltransferase